MTSHAKISVIIAARNAAGTLRTALDSLRAQTRKDWEALVVDSGSTDGTRAMVLDYTRHDGRIQLLETSAGNGGISSVRNHGLAAARGCFVLFLDADHWIAPHALAKLTAALGARPDAGAAYCAHRRVTVGGTEGPPRWTPGVAGAPFDTFARSFNVSMHALMMVRPTIERLGGFEISLETCADWDLVQRLARTGAAFVAVPEALAYDRISPGALDSDVRALLADARIVIDRGFGPDARVAGAATHHAYGTSQRRGMSRQMALGLFAVWCAAVEAGRGRHARDLLHPLPDRRDWVVEACRQAILDGLSLGTGRLVDELASDGPLHADATRRLCAAIAEASGRPALGEQVEYALGPEVFRAAATETRVVGRTLLVRRDIAQLEAIERRDDIELVSIELRRGRQVLARLTLPQSHVLSRAELTRVAAQAIGTWAFVTRTGLHRRPAFWMAAAREGLALAANARRPATQDVRWPAPRAVLRAALRNAAVRRQDGAPTR